MPGYGFEADEVYLFRRIESQGQRGGKGAAAMPEKPVDITTPAIKEEIRAMITQGGNVGLQVLPKI